MSEQYHTHRNLLCCCAGSQSDEEKIKQQNLLEKVRTAKYVVNMNTEISDKFAKILSDQGLTVGNTISGLFQNRDACTWNRWQLCGFFFLKILQHSLLLNWKRNDQNTIVPKQYTLVCSFHFSAADHFTVYFVDGNSSSSGGPTSSATE